MRRLRPLHRRAEQRDLDAAADLAPEVPETNEEDEMAFEPFVQVPSTRTAYPDDEEQETLADLEVIQRSPEPRSRRLPSVHLNVRRPQIHVPRVHLSRPHLNLRLDILFVALFLIALGIFGTLLNLDRIHTDVRTWWPVTIIAAALLWMLVALARRQVTPFLGGAAFGGVGLSLLMQTQDIANARETLLGVVLLAIGLGIVIRGFLLRGRVSA